MGTSINIKIQTGPLIWHNLIYNVIVTAMLMILLWFCIGIFIKICVGICKLPSWVEIESERQMFHQYYQLKSSIEWSQNIASCEHRCDEKLHCFSNDKIVPVPI